jgi:histidinol-phosphatase (PHP family)
MRADYHIHSNFSVDSKLEMEEIVLRSIELGLDEICFTDHVDYDVKNHIVDKQEVDYPEFFREYYRLKSLYEHKINIKIGLEFGVQIHTIPRYVEDMKKYDVDFVLLSCHQIENKELWLNQYQEGKTQVEYNRGYYEYLYQLVDLFDDFSVLGHLDVIKRYDPQGILDDEHVMDIVEKILKRVIEKGKGIEVNTSSYRYNLPDLTPSTRILKKYYELGGRILTIGSDTHRIDQLKDHFEEIIIQLKEIGFTDLYTFEKMNPNPYQI